MSKILNKNNFDYFINYINKDINELIINKNENQKIENPLLKNHHEINNLLYNKPLKNEEEIKNTLNYKILETNMNSNNPEFALIKKEENVDSFEPLINYI